MTTPRTPATPPGTRLILASENLLDEWGTRTEDGYKITAEWGKLRPEGWYEPVFHIDYTDQRSMAEARDRVIAEIAAALDVAWLRSADVQIAGIQRPPDLAAHLLDALSAAHDKEGT